MDKLRTFFTITGFAFWGVISVALLVRLCFAWPGFCVLLFGAGMAGMFVREWRQASAEAYRRGLQDGRRGK
jgi:hypothetical protein